MTSSEAAQRGEDAALLARVARGDRSALEQLYRRHAQWLTSRLQSRCNDPDAVDIAVQDTFVAVWKSAKKYRGDGDVGAWIWGIGTRRLVDQLRKRKITPVPPEAVGPHGHGAGPDHQIVGFEEQFLGELAYGPLGAAVRHLSPDLRAVLILTGVDGLTTKEAATVLGIPQGTVKTRLQRAKAEMKALLP